MTLARHVIPVMLSIFLPMGLGYAIRFLKLFTETEVNGLRKFVIRVCVPFIVFNNLFHANVASLTQFFPAVSAMVVMSLLFGVTAYLVSCRISKNVDSQNAYSLTVFMGNYGFLGWGVMYSFYGEGAFTRSVFFSMFFWPVFLLVGFTMLFLRNRKNRPDSPPLVSLMLRHAAVPVGASLLAIVMNLGKIPVPGHLNKLIRDFAGMTIPMILFTIGLCFTFRMKRSHWKILGTAAVHRLVFGFFIGLLVLWLTELIFPVDHDTSRMILLESVMPAATMSTFYTVYGESNRELVSGIIASSTLASLLTLPFWYYVIEMIV